MTSRWFPAALVVTLFPVVCPGTAAAQPANGNAVLRVFTAKCTACHGPDLPKPKGRFGYVLDLKRVAANPEMVVPFKPEESELWALVSHGEMPPPDSPRGPLTSEQKETIRTWITAGAPEAVAGDSGAARAEAVEQAIPAPAELSAMERLVRWLGKFHLLLLHFPIALVVAAGLAEIVSIWRPKPVPSETVRYTLWLAAATAVPTAALGWLFAAAGNGVSTPQLLMVHRWLGTSAAVLVVFTAVGVEYDFRRGMRSRGVRLLVMGAVLFTGIRAHFGGLLSRGADFFSF